MGLQATRRKAKAQEFVIIDTTAQNVPVSAEASTRQRKTVGLTDLSLTRLLQVSENDGS